MKARIRLMQADIGSNYSYHMIMKPSSRGFSITMVNWQQDVVPYELGEAVARLKRWPALQNALASAIRIN